MFERDLVCPAMLLMSGYTICAVVAFVAGFSHPHDYSSETLIVLVTGTLLFLIPSYAAYLSGLCLAEPRADAEGDSPSSSGGVVGDGIVNADGNCGDAAGLCRTCPRAVIRRKCGDDAVRTH